MQTDLADHLNTYNAPKAFLKSLAEVIREELKDTGVTITTLGATETDFFQRAGMEDTKLDDPAEAARGGFTHL